MNSLRHARVLLALCTVALLVLSATQVGGTQPAPTHYTNLAYPGAIYTGISCINNRGDIVGFYQNSDYIVHHFVYHKGKYTTFKLPASSSYAKVNGINDRGQMVGRYNGEGFLVSAWGVFTPLSLPGLSAEFNGINNRGQITGWYSGRDFLDHGFVYEKGVYTTFDAPNAYATYAFGINNRGQIVGYYIDNDFTILHGFLYDKGVFTDLFVPGSEFLAGAGQTFPTGINDLGEIVGHYNFETPSFDLTQHGFVYVKGVFTSFDAPGSGTGDYVGTYFNGIDNHGQIIGSSVGNFIVFPDHTEAPSYPFLLTR